MKTNCKHTVVPAPETSRSVWSARSLLPLFRASRGSKAAASCAHSIRFATVTAFSLIEILVTVALMSAIILGLLLMFNQVQRAFRGSMVAKDVMEAGRNIMDMIGREIEQMTPSQSRMTMNFFAELSAHNSPNPYTPPNPYDFYGNNVGLMRQGMPGMQSLRTNTVQNVFFLSRVNQDWYATGYRVVPDYLDAGIGTLYRFTTNYPISAPTNWPQLFLSLNPSNTALSKIAEGVVHFRATAYDPKGNPVPSRGQLIRNAATNQVSVYFLSNAVPAYVEIELGIIESQVLDRWRSMAPLGSPPQLAYLSNHIAEVHLFRQRFPVRNVDFAAYQ